MVFVLCGSYTDHCCLQIEKLLEKYQRETIFLNEHSIDQFRFNWDFLEHTGYIVLGKYRAELKKIEAVLLRWNRNKAGANEDEIYKNYELEAALLAWSHSISCPVINKYTPEYWYGEGPTYYNLQHQLYRAGFKSLSSLITQSLDKAQDFLNRHNQQVFFQTVSSLETIYSLKDINSDDLLTKVIGKIPIILSEYPDGERLEAFVVKNDVLLADRNGISVNLDTSLIQIIKRLTMTINLSFFQVHIIKIGNNSYSCIGFNDLPNYEWCSTGLKEKINNQLIRALGIN